MPNRTEVIERLRKRAAVYGRDAALQHKAGHPIVASSMRGQAQLLTQAADLLEAGEITVERRTVRSDGLPGAAHEASLAEMEAHRDSLEAEDGRTYRIQHSEVTRTPWTDLEEAED